MKYKLSLALLLQAALVQAQVIDNKRGIDSRVDYKSLQNLAPWDDRNYQLTLEDLDLLYEDEEKITNLVPLFFRVQFHKDFPNSKRNKFLPYPKSLYNHFINRYNGYLIDNKIYKKLKWDATYQHLHVETSSTGSSPGEIIRQQVKALSADKLVANGAESAIAVSPTNPNIVILGLNSGSGGQKMMYSSDGGNNWNASTDLTGTECCDPTVDWNSTGSYAYTATLGYGDVWIYRSDDNGMTWDSFADSTPGDDRREVGNGANTFSDKEYIHVDKYPTSPYKDNVYVLWDADNIMVFARSDDNGNTFTTQAFTSDFGIGADLVTTSNGDVYNFWPNFSYEIRMNKSTNGGVTFTNSSSIATTIGNYEMPIPSMDIRKAFTYVSADVDLSGGTYHDRIYVAWTDNAVATTNVPADNHARIQVAYSDDGANWTVTTPHETNDVNTVDRWHQWLKVDKNGTVHVVFYDTRQFADRKGVDFYHSFSSDGGVTWSTPNRLTSESSPAAPSIPDTFQFGDYNGLDFGINANSGIAIFSDNRIEGGGTNDMDVYVAPVAMANDLIFKNGFE